MCMYSPFLPGAHGAAADAAAAATDDYFVYSQRLETVPRKYPRSFTLCLYMCIHIYIYIYM